MLYPLIICRLMNGQQAIVSSLGITNRHRTLAINAEPNPPPQQIGEKPQRDDLSRSQQLHTTSHTQRIQEIPVLNTTGNQVFQSKWADAVLFFEFLTHQKQMSEVQDKVSAIQSQLFEAQRRRSQLMNELTMLRRELQGNEDELTNCNRKEDRYLGLVRQQINARKAEEAKLLEYQKEELNERNLFTHLTAATAFLHQKEKTYSNNYRNFSVVLSILASFFGILGTSIAYQHRQKLLRDEIELVRSTIERDRMRSNPESWTSYIGRKSCDVGRFFWRW